MDRCTTCQFYDRQARGAEKTANAGQCRRSAPALSPINQKSYMIEGVWPTVRDDDWCGEWKALARRADPSRIGDLLGTSRPATLPPGTPRLAGAGLPPPRLAGGDPLSSPLSGLAASGRGDD